MNTDRVQPDVWNMTGVGAFGEGRRAEGGGHRALMGPGSWHSTTDASEND